MSDTPKNVDDDKLMFDTPKNVDDDIIVLGDSPPESPQKIDENDDTVLRLDEVVNDSLKVPLTKAQLDEVKNNEWIGSDVIDAVIAKDVIENHPERLMVSALIWSSNRPLQFWSATNDGIRRLGRVPTVPHYSTTFQNVIIPININNQHWTLAILDKQTKKCVFYDTMKGNLPVAVKTKLMLICRLLVGEECTYQVAPSDSFIRQRDGINCGPMVCMLAEKKMNNKSLFFNIAEVNQWRNDVYNFYAAFLPAESNVVVVINTNHNRKTYAEILKSSKDTSQRLDKAAKNVKSLNESATKPTSSDKKAEKRKMAVEKDDEIIEKIQKVEIVELTVQKAMEVDTNDSDLSSGEKDTVVEVTMSLMDFCKKKRLNPKNPKHIYKYNQWKMTEDDKVKDLERKKEAMRKKRAEDKAVKEANDLQKIQAKKLSQHLIKTMKNKDAKSKADNRLKKSEEDNHIRKQKDAEAKQIVRENETDEEKQVRLQKDAETKQILRENETDEEKQVRLQKDAEAKQSIRDKETEEQKSQRLSDVQSQMASLRASQRSQKHQAVISARKQRISNAQVKTVFVPRKGGNHNNVTAFKLGKRDIRCYHCRAKHFQTETQHADGTFTSCCQKGKIALNVGVDNYPVGLKKLITREHTDKGYVKNFCENIRFYNSSISCAHFYAKNVKLAPGVPCLKIQGKVLHKMAKTYLPSGNNATFGGQSYIVDSDQATATRMNVPANKDAKLKEEIMKFLDEMMRLNNIYAQSFEMLKETLENDREIREITGEPEKDLRLVFVGKPNVPRNYDKVEAQNEIALVYTPGPNGEVPRDDIVIVKNKNGQFINEKLTELDPRIEPLCYPIFNPTGKGKFWDRQNRDLNDPASKKLTRREYVAYKIQDRDEDEAGFNPLLWGGKLLLQYLCDFWSQIEGDKLSFLNKNQDKIRAASYKDVIESLNKKAQQAGRTPGTIKILPSTFYGGPRYLRELCSDAISMVDEYGKPTFMATMTVNPGDEDVISNIYENQSPWERPDVINSVFYQKMHELIRVIEKDEIFGKVECSVVVVEFQKRGLPHCHCVFTLTEKWDTNEKVDTYIQAYLPPTSQEDADACGEEFDQEHFDLVKKFLIHKPCGVHNPNAPCMVNGKCKRGFPKPFCEETIMDDNGFTRPKRPDNKRSFKMKVNKEDIDVDNRWVVPHNPYLLKYFKCHLNVEAINSVTTVFYVFKYMFKGDDKAFIEMNEYIDNEVRQNLNYDEIKSYEDFRYISACEAHWRISDLLLYRLSHSVDRLPVHLENEQTVIMDENPDADQMQNAANKNSKLMAFFEINKVVAKEIEEANAVIADLRAKGLPVDHIHIPQKILYKDVGKNHVWDGKEGKWNKRKKTTKPKLCRMYNVNPRQTQRFYLRRLLMAVAGPTSFEELRTVEGVICDTYREACVALGLIVNDKLYEDTLEEALNRGTPNQLRYLFARLLAHCELGNPLALFEKYEAEFTADLLKKWSPEDAKKVAIRRIVKSMMNQDKQLSDYPDLEKYMNEIGMDVEDTIDVQAMLKEGEEAYETLNFQQKFIADTILEILKSAELMGRCFWIDGPGGSGKSYLFNTIRKLALGHGKKVVIMAWSGIAASLYPFGRTCHNAFKLDFPFLHDSNSNVIPSSAIGKMLEEADIIIWDEFPMAPKRALEVVEEKLREIMGNTVAFGGKIMLTAGDFRQTLPIVENATRQETVNTAVCCSWLWSLFRKFNLTENVRALPNEVEFKNMLLAIGEGTFGPNSDSIEIPDEIKSKGDIVDEIFGDVLGTFDPATVMKRGILATWNSDVDELNERVLNLLDPEEEKTYMAQDVYHYGDEILQSAGEIHESYKTKSIRGLPSFALRLRKNAVVMLVRNLSIEDGLCNGTRLVVTQMLRHNLLCRKINIDGSLSDEILIPRISLTTKHGVIDVTRHQFPVKLAFCMTINKAQGQTFDKVGVVLNHDCFSHGQLYVAFSRVRSLEGLKVLLPNGKNETPNIVYKELLELGKQ